MGRVILALVSLAALTFTVGCMTERDKLIIKSQPTKTGSLVSYLDNSDVVWSAGTIGLDPSLKTKIAKRVLNRGKSANPALLGALKNEKTFAVAHVILTKLNLKYFDLNNVRWNNLKVKKINADGTGEYDKSQIPKLIEFWERVIALETAK